MKIADQVIEEPSYGIILSELVTPFQFVNYFDFFYIKFATYAISKYVI